MIMEKLNHTYKGLVMTTYQVDFIGSIDIEADSPEEAVARFSDIVSINVEQKAKEYGLQIDFNSGSATHYLDDNNDWQRV